MNEEKKNHGPDRRVGDRRDRAGTEMYMQPGQQPAAYESAKDADDHVAHDPKPGTTQNVTGQPSRNESDEQSGKETLTGHDAKNVRQQALVPPVPKL
jgi:hypothetical protein